MDSPIVTQLFRQLFRHRPRGCQARRLRGDDGPRRGYATRASRDRGMRTNESRWQHRTDILAEDRLDEFAKYPSISLEELKTRTQRPRRVKMLLRDFIDDSLYNPSYGYFSKQAVIFSPGTAFDFGSFRDELDFQRELARRYDEFEDGLDAAAGGPDAMRQLWHTPTELFGPYYGEAVARYLVSNYRLTTYPYDDLVIFEVGAGRGTLMLNILDHIRDTDPQVYARTRYTIVEISPAMAAVQAARLRATAHADRVDIERRSIFDWDRRVPTPCFFLALEVFDNLAHDGIRYDVETEAPLQGHVLVDADGDFHEFYLHRLDPVAARFFRLRHAATAGAYPRPYPPSALLRRLAARLPLAANLSDPEYVPTRLMQFFDVLERHFPAHRLLAADFAALPDAVRGLNAPVVQTRYRRTMVPVSTPLVHQGFFDILFPTDFAVAEALYRAITGRLTRVLSHGDFMRRWADVDDTRTRSGESPLLTHYRNASVLLTV
ncbi:hypothetical protein CDD83_2163 [Cordyceps sp. RAO-2017]|nr:hypothetical protein CDD83_2163 [Cordyceps sp. RAO-2017]